MTVNNTKNLLTVYHGTISIIDTIDVARGRPYKDFGRGFYVTESFDHAKNLALRNKYLEQDRSRNTCSAYVYTYILDMEKTRNFTIKQFDIADLDWMHFVLSNRSVRDKNHDYDIVIGPTANDDTSVVLKSYFNGLYGDVNSEQALQLALDMIEADNLPEQIYFGTNKSTVCLIQKGNVRTV